MHTKISALVMRETLRRKGRKNGDYGMRKRSVDQMKHVWQYFINSAREWDITLYALHSIVLLIMLHKTHQKN